MARRRRRLGRHLSGLLGALVVALIALAALFAPGLAPADPNTQDIALRLRPPAWLPGGELGYLLGTDQLGRDLLTRILYGARVSLLVGVASAALAAALGVTLGLVSGYFGGLPDHVIMRLADIQLAFPFLLLAIALIAVLRPGLGNLIAVLGISGWVLHSRMVRAQVLSIREKEFILAVRALGSSDTRMIVRHIFPNVLPTIIVIATLQVAQFIIAESSLSFLGLGLPPVVPSWGGIMNEGREYIFQAWWIESFPGVALVLLVSGFGLLGDWLRDVLDPKLRM